MSDACMTLCVCLSLFAIVGKTDADDTLRQILDRLLVYGDYLDLIDPISGLQNGLVLPVFGGYSPDWLHGA